MTISELDGGIRATWDEVEEVGGASNLDILAEGTKPILEPTLAMRLTPLLVFFNRSTFALKSFEMGSIEEEPRNSKQINHKRRREK